MLQECHKQSTQRKHGTKLASKLYSTNLCKEVFHMTVPQVEYKGKHITGKFLE